MHVLTLTTRLSSLFSRLFGAGQRSHGRISSEFDRLEPAFWSIYFR